MIEYKQGKTARVLVRLVDVSGNPITGKTYTDVAVTVLKSDTSTVMLAVGVQDWGEVTVGAFANEGVYVLAIPASAVDMTGVLSYAVKATGAIAYIGAVKVVANEEEDTFAAAGMIAGEVAGLRGLILLLKKYQEGRWKMHTSGPDAGRIVYYDSDGTTPLIKFDLRNRLGEASVSNPLERIPVV